MTTPLTAADRDLLDPILGGETMRGLLDTNPDTWAKAGDLITRAYLAGRHAPGTVHLTPAQARWLSILAAQDLRADEARGRTAANSGVIRDTHDPAWEALQPACHWEPAEGPE